MLQINLARASSDAISSPSRITQAAKLSKIHEHQAIVFVRKSRPRLISFASGKRFEPIAPSERTFVEHAGSHEGGFSGVAGLRQVDVGNIVNAATQTGIVTIAQIEPIAAIFTAPEDQLPAINDAQSARPLKAIALTTDGKKTLSEGALFGGQ